MTSYYQAICDTPLGPMRLLANDQAIVGAWFCGQRYDQRGYEQLVITKGSHPLLDQASDWMSAYFSGKELPEMPPLEPQGTVFQQQVWQALQQIPLGRTMTYGQLAKELGCGSSQAVGGAIGKNPISLLIPCHRVIGGNGALTGYAGGIPRKAWLLAHEKKEITNDFIPIP